LGTSQFYFSKHYAFIQRTAFFQKRAQRYGLFSDYKKIFEIFFSKKQKSLLLLDFLTV